MIPIEFLSSESNVRGYLFPSSGDIVIATVLFLQGFPGTEGDELICRRLAKANANVLTFNYRGTFQSEGEFSFSNAVADIGAALKYLKAPKNQREFRIDTTKIVLGGWSFGSGIAPAGTVRNQEIKKLFLISGRDFFKEAQHIAQDPDYEKEVRKNLETIQAPEGPVNFRDDILSDLVANQAAFEINKLVPLLIDRDILLIGGWDDGVVPIEDHILPLYRSLAEKGAKVSIKAYQDDHEFSESKDQIVELIIKWLHEN
jgi:pimeloyl-ACP methyl ester carboxylesterase